MANSIFFFFAIVIVSLPLKYIFIVIGLRIFLLIIHSHQRMESQEEREGTEVSGASEKPIMRMVYYYYINYREFANVVKYKLHRMRQKLEEEDSKAVRTGCAGCMCVISVQREGAYWDPRPPLLPGETVICWHIVFVVDLCTYVVQ